MGSRTAGVALVALLFIVPGLAQAQARMYKCVDDKGKVYYTQVPPKECLGKETREMSRGGQLLKRNEVLTPEQRAAQEEEKKKKAEQEVREREERRKNAALLNTYSSEKDIEEARARALKENEEAIKQTEKKIADATKRRKQLESEKEFYLKKPIPPKLADDIKNNEIEIKTQQELLDAKKKQVSTLNAKYDEDKRRYIELTRGGASGKATAARK